MILLVLLAGTVSMLAVAAKLIADKKATSTTMMTRDLPGVKDEYARLMRKFLQQDSAIHLSGAVSIYDGEEPTIAKEKSTFISLRSGHSFYSSLSFQQTFSNGRFLVQLDSLHRILFVSSTSDSSKNPSAAPDPAGMIDKLFSDTASFKISGTVSGDDKDRSIMIKSDFNPEIQSFTIRYSPIDYSLKSAEIRFWKNGQYSGDSTTNHDKVWISKIDYREYPAKELNIDSMINKVLVIRGNSIEPTSAYKDYRVIIK